MRCISRNLSSDALKILLLGYSENESSIADAIKDCGHEVWHYDQRLDDLQGFDLVISYGYRFILNSKIVNNTDCPVVNLHISYLPYNRGAYPNFWSFYNNTPKGVTIIQADEGIDTGPILYRREVTFTADETTFASTYRRLRQEVESLFLENKAKILAKVFNPEPQPLEGTFYRVKDLPEEFAGWNSEIDVEIARLRRLSQKKSPVLVST